MASKSDLKAKDILNLVEELFSGVRWYKARVDKRPVEIALVEGAKFTLDSKAKNLKLKFKNCIIEMEVPNDNTAKRLVSGFVPFVPFVTDTNKALEILETQIDGAKGIFIRSFCGT